MATKKDESASEGVSEADKSATPIPSSANLAAKALMGSDPREVLGLGTAFKSLDYTLKENILGNAARAAIESYSGLAAKAILDVRELMQSDALKAIEAAKVNFTTDWKNPFAIPGYPLSAGTNRGIELEIERQEDRIQQLERDLADAKRRDKERKKVQEELAAQKELVRKMHLDLTISLMTILLDRISSDAGAKVLKCESLRNKLLGTATNAEGVPNSYPMYVMSIDIRNSTDLMLNATSPDAFANFITSLCDRLQEIVKSNHGVIDKFTGDGILCFFPDFFTGDDGGLYAVRAAQQCHLAFDTIYRDSRSSFSPVILDTGLGIGIDYGPCPIVKIAGGLTVVGKTVVHACRLGSAPRGKTLANQSAFDAISCYTNLGIQLSESSLEFKHKGPVLVYAVEMTPDNLAFAPPAWIAEPDELETTSPATKAE